MLGDDFEFEHSQPPFSDDDVSAFQRHAGVTLPTSYVEFLRRHNGGSPSRSLFQTEDGKEWVFGWLFHLSGKGPGISLPATGTGVPEVYDLWFNYQSLKTYLPQGMIPIGEDPSGNMICMDLRQSPESIWLWHHDYGGELKETGMDFRTFIDSLTA